MKVVQINITCGRGSTGKICLAISQLLTEQNIENYVLYSSQNSDYPLAIKYTDDLYVKGQALLSRLRGNYGFNSRSATKSLLRHLDKIQPDVVHLHNLHGHNVHLPLLFSYLKRKNIKVYWTFHDCWAFTAYCPYFTLVDCDKWQTTCTKCPQHKHYSWFFDRSQILFQKKRALFAGLDLTIITPSQWLADLVKQSFLKDYPVKVIHNGIDLTVFKPTPSDFRLKYHCEEKILLLGVAFDWGIRKGLDVLIDLAKRLDARYQIVLVGTNEEIDRQLPENIISIHRTQNQRELAEIYTAADLYVIPTREDNFPTVNLESLACGTPVLTFPVGGSPEMLNPTCGAVTKECTTQALQKEIERITTEHPFTTEACVKRAQAFDQNEKFKEYIQLYKQNLNI